MPLWLDLNDLHLVGKLLDICDGDLLAHEGFTAAERERAEALYNTLDPLLTRAVGVRWDDLEVL